MVNSSIVFAFFSGALIGLLTMGVAYFLAKRIREPRDRFPIEFKNLRYDLVLTDDGSGTLIKEFEMRALNKGVATVIGTVRADSTVPIRHSAKIVGSEEQLEISNTTDGRYRFALPKTVDNMMWNRIREERFVESAFNNRDEYFTSKIEQPTKSIEINIEFPDTRKPNSAFLVVERSGVSLSVDQIAVKRKGGEESEVRESLWCCNVRIKHPPLSSVYHIRWSW